jgi:hypothetical protein
MEQQRDHSSPPPPDGKLDLRAQSPWRLRDAGSRFDLLSANPRTEAMVASFLRNFDMKAGETRSRPPRLQANAELDFNQARRRADG